MELIDNYEISDISSEEYELSKYGSNINILPKVTDRASLLNHTTSMCPDFIKWLKKTNPEITTEMPAEINKVGLHSNEFWFPLVYLSDIAIQTYLNIVFEYILFRMRGSLINESARANLEIIFKDESSGVLKRIKYSGPAEGLKKIDTDKAISSVLSDKCC